MINIKFLLPCEVVGVNCKTDKEVKINFRQGKELKGVGVTLDFFDSSIIHILSGNVQFSVSQKYIEINTI